MAIDILKNVQCTLYMYRDHPKLVTQMDNPCNPFLDLCMDDLVGNGKLIAIAIAGSNFGTLLWEEMAVFDSFYLQNVSFVHATKP